MTDWTNAPPGITASHERHNSPYQPDARWIKNINIAITPTVYRLYVTVPSGQGFRDVFINISADEIAAASVEQEAQQKLALKAENAELRARVASEREKANALADKLYAVQQQTEGGDIWVAMHEAEERAQQRAELRAQQRAEEEAA